MFRTSRPSAVKGCGGRREPAGVQIAGDVSGCLPRAPRDERRSARQSSRRAPARARGGGPPAARRPCAPRSRDPPVRNTRARLRRSRAGEPEHTCSHARPSCQTRAGARTAGTEVSGSCIRGVSGERILAADAVTGSRLTTRERSQRRAAAGGWIRLQPAARARVCGCPQPALTSRGCLRAPRRARRGRSPPPVRSPPAGRDARAIPPS